jgi:hypothetical protein
MGCALLLATLRDASFRPSRIFTPDSSWDVGLGGFLLGFAVPWRDAFDGALQALRAADGAGTILGAFTLVALAAGIVFALRGWRGVARLRALAAFLLLTASTALLFYYAVQLLIWLAARIGFWVFLLLLMLFQRWRYAPAPSH